MNEAEVLIEKLPEEAKRLTVKVPHPGRRRDTLLDVTNFAAEAGFTNHEILVILEELADRWKVLPSSNKYDRWSRMLAMIRNARQHHPGPPNGRAKEVTGGEAE